MQAARSRTGRAIVVGGSMSGLLTALLLARRGWEARIYERSEVELAGRGAGLVTHPELFEVLADAGARVTEEDLGVPVVGRRTLDRDGRIIGERPLPQTLTSWDRLFHLMRERVPEGHYVKSRQLERIEQDESEVRARFADGTTASGDLLVGADGIRSTVRAQFLPEVEPLYAGYVAWRGLVDEAALSAGTHEALFGHFAFCLPPREQMLGYPVAGPGNDMRPSHRRYNFVWYRPADEASELRRLMTDAEGTHYPLGIPPAKVNPEVVREVRAAAEAILAPQFGEVVRLTEKPFFQPIYDLETPRAAFGRIVLVGDAAFVARPHVGAGVTKAASDARTLADALDAHGDDVESALTAYEAPRLAEGAAIIARARHLGAYMQAQLRTAEERANAEKHRTPEAVMAETATLDFLHER